MKNSNLSGFYLHKDFRDRNILIIIMGGMLVFFSGCGGDSEEGEAEEVEVKSKAEYKQQAEEQINEENMEEELATIEENLEEELSSQQ